MACFPCRYIIYKFLVVVVVLVLVLILLVIIWLDVVSVAAGGGCGCDCNCGAILDIKNVLVELINTASLVPLDRINTIRI